MMETESEEEKRHYLEPIAVEEEEVEVIIRFSVVEDVVAMDST